MATIQLRRDTAANWVSANPTLAIGELGLVTDKGVFYVGDGSTAFNSLLTFQAFNGWSTKTSAYTLLADEGGVLVDATSGGITITLPTASVAIGRTLVIKKIDSAANNVTVDGDGSETIDGATTQVITTQYESLTLISDGTQWWIV